MSECALHTEHTEQGTVGQSKQREITTRFMQTKGLTTCLSYLFVKNYMKRKSIAKRFCVNPEALGINGIKSSQELTCGEINV